MRGIILLISLVGLSCALLGASWGADDEDERLSELKDRECGELERRLGEAAGEQRSAVLLQLARNGTPRAVAVIEQQLETADDRGTLLNAVAGIGKPHAAPVLLRAARSGTRGGLIHAVERLHLVLGPEALGPLRLFQKEEGDERVLRAIRQELVRLKDQSAVADLEKELAGLEVESREGAQRAIDLLSVALDSHSSEAGAEVGRLLLRVDWKRSDVHRQLKQYAAGTALWLGNRESVLHVIDLLKDPGSARFDYPGLHPLDEVLKRYTKREFGSAREWEAWWEKEGRHAGLFTRFVPPQDEIGIINAVVAWGQSEASGRFIGEGTVHLETASKYIEGRAGLWKGLDRGICVYTPDEITLLGAHPYGVESIESDGQRAFAVLGDGRSRMKWRLRNVELSKSGARWRVASP